MRKTELATLSHYADLYLFAQVLLLVKWAPFFSFSLVLLRGEVIFKFHQY